MSDIDRLIRFVVVAEELSFSKAARRLNVDQPWLSRQIFQLEAQIDQPLFIRTSRRVSLTREGQALLVHARRLSNAAAACLKVVEKMSQAQQRQLSIGISPYAYWLPARRALIRRFEAQEPTAVLVIASGLSMKLISRLRDRTLDLAIVPDGAAGDDLESLVIERIRVSLLIPVEHPLAALPSIGIAQLAGERFATTDPSLNPVMHAMHYAPFLEAGAVPVVVTDGQVAIPFLARARRIIAIDLGGPMKDMELAGDFRRVELADGDHAVSYCLTRRREPPGDLSSRFWQMAARAAKG